MSNPDREVNPILPHHISLLMKTELRLAITLAEYETNNTFMKRVPQSPPLPACCRRSISRRCFNVLPSKSSDFPTLLSSPAIICINRPCKSVPSNSLKARTASLGTANKINASGRGSWSSPKGIWIYTHHTSARFQNTCEGKIMNEIRQRINDSTSPPLFKKGGLSCPYLSFRLIIIFSFGTHGGGEDEPLLYVQTARRCFGDLLLLHRIRGYGRKDGLFWGF